MKTNLFFLAAATIFAIGGNAFADQAAYPCSLSTPIGSVQGNVIVELGSYGGSDIVTVLNDGTTLSGMLIYNPSGKIVEIQLVNRNITTGKSSTTKKKVSSPSELVIDGNLLGGQSGKFSCI